VKKKNYFKSFFFNVIIWQNFATLPLWNFATNMYLCAFNSKSTK